MLNLKKGLAIALAAATALTFAPVSTLDAHAEAGYGGDDGYTYSAGIDSIEQGAKTYTIARDKTSLTFTHSAAGGTLSADGTASSIAIKLKEHNDFSNAGGQEVKSYRITISRPQLKTATTDYNGHSDLVVPIKATAAAGGSGTPATFVPSKTWTPSSIQSSDTTGLKEWSATANQNELSETATYFIANKKGEKGATNDNSYDVYGADLNLVALNSNNFKSSTVTVTIEGLASTEDDATATEPALSSSTITINVPQSTESLSIKPSNTLVAEGDTVLVPWHVANQSKATVLTVSSNPSDLIEAPTKGTTVSGSTTDDVLQFKAIKAGTTVVTIYAKATDTDADKDAISSASFELTITAGNGKLRVSYDTDANATYKTVGTGATVRTDGQHLTFTDDAEDVTRNVGGVVEQKSSKRTVANDGTFTVTAQPKTGVNDSYLVDKNGNYIAKTQTNASSLTTTTAPNVTATAGVTSIKDITGTAGGTQAQMIQQGRSAVTYFFNTDEFLPAARPITSGGQTTLQINAQSDADATVSYALVAKDHIHDDADNATSTTTAKTGKKSKDYIYNPVSGQFEGSFDYYTPVDPDDYTQGYAQIGSAAGPNDSYVYSTAAAKKYGAVDNTGLVTLKNSAVDNDLYVVITAKASDKTAVNAKRQTSTFVVPIATSDTKPLEFYAASENGFAEVDVDGLGTMTPTAEHTIYLSDDHKSDKITVDTNIANSANYVTGDVTNTNGSFTYEDGVLSVTPSAQDGARTDLVIRTTSAPDIAGTVTATFHVEYHKNNKNTNDLNLTDVSVSRTSPRAKIARKATVDGSTVVFEDQLYVKDNSRKSGFRRVKSTENEYGAVSASSTGWVTYQKNDGEVYVRAYARATGYNPTGYKYAKVTFGQNKNANDFKLDTTPVQIKVGETSTIKATASTGSAITFTSSDPSVATVDEKTGVVTGVKKGVAQITVNAAETDTALAASDLVTVVVSDENSTPAEYKNPAQVKGVKLGNKKGAKVVVKFTKDTTDKNIKYYVQKKVGKKTSGKSVGSNRTILSVKKGATVKVRVKAYYYDANGVKHVGKYSKWVTKKTDKK